jgi:hypothetical protein
VPGRAHHRSHQVTAGHHRSLQVTPVTRVIPGHSRGRTQHTGHTRSSPGRTFSHTRSHQLRLFCERQTPGRTGCRTRSHQCTSHTRSCHVTPNNTKVTPGHTRSHSTSTHRVTPGHCKSHNHTPVHHSHLRSPGCTRSRQVVPGHTRSHQVALGHARSGQVANIYDM